MPRMERADAVQKARIVAEVAAQHGDESERGRRLAPPVVTAVEASGLNGLVSPTAIGGHAASPETMVAVVAEVARGDASTAWCAGIGMGSNFLAAILSEDVARDLFTDLDRGGAGPFAPTGRAEATEGGY